MGQGDKVIWRLVLIAGCAGLLVGCGSVIQSREDKAIEDEVSIQIMAALPDDVESCALSGRCTQEILDRGGKLLLNLEQRSKYVKDKTVREHYAAKLKYWKTRLDWQRASQDGRDLVRSNPLIEAPEPIDSPWSTCKLVQCPGKKELGEVCVECPERVE